MASTLAEYYSGIGQSLPSVSERSKVYESKGLGSAAEYKGTAEQNTRLLGVLSGGGGSSSSPSVAQSGSSKNYEYGGWYDNPETGKNQRWFNGVWTNGEEPNAPKQSSDVNSYLNTYQNSVLKSSAPEVRVPTMDELKTQLLPSGNAPTPINRAETREKLRTEYGLSDLEQKLSDIKKEEADLAAGFRAQRVSEEGKTVPLNVIAGRVSEEERQYMDRQDFITRTKAVVVDELNTKYSIINQYVQDIGLDYQDAVKRYDDEFARNVQMYSIITGKEKDARSAYESDRAAASANLNIYMNAITKGNLDYNSMAPDQKLLVNKLEIQAGLPQGFMSNLKMDPGANIVFTSSNDGVTQVGIRNKDGTISVQNYGTRISSGGSGKAPSESEIKRSYISAAKEDAGNYTTLKQMLSIYGGELEPQTIYEIYNSNSPWGAATEDPQTLAKYGIKADY